MTADRATVMVTGGAGFIGSAVIRHLLARTEVRVVNIDKLTYAANPASLAAVQDDPRYRFEHADIGDAAAMARLFAAHRPRAIMHLAAESHVDRSIDGPAPFIQTNVTGTCTLLEAARDYWGGLEAEERHRFRFHHVSTDEVYGSLGETGAFTEDTAYDPRSPYAASKAAADHLVRAWHHTYGLPVLISNSSNNYGPCQFPEKLIPLLIIKALADQPLPVYGTGANVRDWLYVDDHADALWTILSRGRPGRGYNVGGGQEVRNIDVARAVCRLLDEMAPRGDGRPHATRISFVADRPGHDFRYAIDGSRLRSELGWQPSESFESGLRQTVAWYLARRDWWEPILCNRYGGERIGLAAVGA